ncbi:MAG: CRTAC1 family protein [Planctomycetota bacterium]|nr:CRTAC1 family protein [Planctomycetota bacterium]
MKFFAQFGPRKKRIVLESTGAGVALLDYDLDGDLDLYFVNGWSGSVLKGKSRPVRNALFRNVGEWKFEDVTDAAGVGDTGWGGGCAIGDVDGDGDPDIYVTNFGANVFYENLGDGTFRERAVEAGIADMGWGLSAAFGDVDDDGDLDLYVTNYIDLDLDNPGRAGGFCPWLGLSVFCGPAGLVAKPDRLFQNDGTGRFQDISKTSGIHDVKPGFGMGVVFGDLDEDGRTDIYIANDSGPNFLYRNLGQARFEEVGTRAGVAYKSQGDSQAGMGTDLGDANGDGRAEIFVTNFSQDHNTLYKNDGLGLFSCATHTLGLGDPSWLFVGWGTKFFDLENDGDLDLFVANGHVYPSVDDNSFGMSYRQRDHLFINTGRGRYREKGASRIRTATPDRSSRGAAFGDLDNDGDLDVVISAMDGAPMLLENRGGNRKSWLEIRLIGTWSNREGAGARIVATCGRRRFVREATRSGSYCSSNDPRVHFGLGNAVVVDLLEVHWPSGTLQRFSSVPVSREIKIHEERGILTD